jgi:hypothetical protein
MIKSEPRVLRVSMAIYQQPLPMISYGVARWKQKKWGMDYETKRNLGKGCNRRPMHHVTII